VIFWVKSIEMQRYLALVEVFKVVAIVFISAVIIRYFVFQPFVVEGSSMEPDFRSGEYLLIEKLGYRFKEPARGDVVVFHYPLNQKVNYIKRIIALPGERLTIRDGQVLVDGRLLRESYLAPEEKTYLNRDPERPYEIVLTTNQYFVLGDNRDHSSDSRDWGPLERRHIIGRSALVLYPRAEFRAVASPQY